MAVWELTPEIIESIKTDMYNFLEKLNQPPEDIKAEANAFIQEFKQKFASK